MRAFAISILLLSAAVVKGNNHGRPNASSGDITVNQTQDVRPPQRQVPARGGTRTSTPGSVGPSTLEKIEDSVKRNGQPELLRDLWMAVDLPVTRIGPTDFDLDALGEIYLYSFMPVEKSLHETTVGRLTRLEELPVTECYKTSSPRLKIPQHTRCRFVRGIPFEPPAFEGPAADTFLRWKSKLNANTITKVWVEVSARVSDKGAPVEKFQRASPVAILTDNGLYLAVEYPSGIIPKSDQIIVRGAPAFSITGTADARPPASRVKDIFLEELTNEFGAPPILAQPDLSDRSHGSEIIFKRWNLKSNVVGRENFIKWEWWNSTYERSVFEIQWNCDRLCHTVLIKLNHTFFVSNDNRDYDERKWPPGQLRYYLELYRRAATESYLRAVRRTCDRLRGAGTMSGDVCKIRGNIL